MGEVAIEIIKGDFHGIALRGALAYTSNIFMELPHFA